MKFMMMFALLAVSLTALAQELVLSVETPASVVRVGDHSRFAVTIRNRGSNSVTLVQPGDGSARQSRTPFVGWSILPADAKKLSHPETPSLPEGPFCGNINSVRLSEVFSLKPGETRRLEDWIGNPTFEKPGRYRLVCYYQNIPEVKVSGIPLRPHENGALDRMRKSTPCRLTSDEIVVDVLPKSP